MKKVLILTVFVIFLSSCQGKLVQLTATPDFGEGKTDDSVVPDDDSPVTDDDSGNTGNTGDTGNTGNTGDTGNTGNTGNTAPDDDEVPDEVPDEIGVECEPDGEKKCNGQKTVILECIDGAWETNETCENDETCKDTRESITCAPHICTPEATYCKSGNVYTCANDGLSEEMTTECTATQYCDDSSTPNFPAICVDQVCTPNELYCDANALKECNAQGSGGTVEKDCNPDGVCDIVREDCVYMGELGGDTASPNNRTGQRGNFFDCTKNVKVIEFAQRFNYTGSKNLTWAIYEAEENSTTYQKIFTKTSTITGTGDAQYSTGTISVNLVSGKKYLFVTAWAGQISFYDNGANHPINVGFGASSAGYIGGDVAPEQLLNPSPFNLVYNQKIVFIGN